MRELEQHWGPGHRQVPRLWLPPSREAWQNRERKNPTAFDFSGRMIDLIAHIAQTMPEFGFIRTTELQVDVTAARNNTKFGLQARLTPMRLEGGVLLKLFRGRRYQLQSFHVDGRRLLYVITFCMPRFLSQPFHEKLATVFHELLHMSPAYDGDIRRFGGRYTVHSRSKDDFHGQAIEMAQRYEQTQPEPMAFLRFTHDELWRAYGGITAVRLPRPKLILIEPKPTT